MICFFTELLYDQALFWMDMNLLKIPIPCPFGDGDTLTGRD